MNTSSVPIKEPMAMPVAVERTDRAAARAPAPVAKSRVMTLLAVPVAAGASLMVHGLLSGREPSVDPRTYSVFLGLVLGVFALGALVQTFWSGLRQWMTHLCPIIAAAVWLLC